MGTGGAGRGGGISAESVRAKERFIGFLEDAESNRDVARETYERAVERAGAAFGGSRVTEAQNALTEMDKAEAVLQNLADGRAGDLVIGGRRFQAVLLPPGLSRGENQVLVTLINRNLGVAGDKLRKLKTDRMEFNPTFRRLAGEARMSTRLAKMGNLYVIDKAPAPKLKTVEQVRVEREFARRRARRGRRGRL